MNRPSAPAEGRSVATGGPLHRLLDLFSSVTFGIWLLVILFVYCTIGSAGVLYPVSGPDGWSWVHEQLRQRPGLEMTEFEWFHWWPFTLLMGLICANITTVTVRRIPFRPVNYGVWMIHSGILILSLGSAWYFGTKVEGDSPVTRRQVSITLPTGQTAVMPAVPGNVIEVVGDDGAWTFYVNEINRAWPILSGPDKGSHAFSVTVSVRSPTRVFKRQLLVGFPEYTEDIISTGNPQQPFSRAVKVTGDKLVDRDLVLALDYAPQTWMYLAHNMSKSWALYLREKGQTEWVQRPIEGAPLYNDYLTSMDQVWLPEDVDFPLRPLDIHAPAVEDGDPLPDTDLRVTGYLRHARDERRWVPGNRQLFPVATVRLHSETGDSERQELVAFDPVRQLGRDGLVRLRWAHSEDVRSGMSRVEQPKVRIRVPEAGFDEVVPVLAISATDPHLPFTAIPGSVYEYRFEAVYSDLQVEADVVVSICSVELRTPDDHFKRWVPDNPTKEPRDMPLDESGAMQHVERELDRGIDIAFMPGTIPAPVTVVAGPGEAELSLLLHLSEEAPSWKPVVVGEAIDLRNGVHLTVEDFISHATSEERPTIVAQNRRERDTGVTFAKMRLAVPTGGGHVQSVWVSYHNYPVVDRNHTLRRYWLQPVEVTLGGRRIEMILSRQRVPLTHPVVLDDFEVATHVGGFSGRVSSIRDWTSRVRFDTGGVYTAPIPVSMNKPGQFEGYSYYQAQWDPPAGPRWEGDASSEGQNYTVLGVGNGNGRWMMLLGVIVSVIGMIYAFYVKPVIRRRNVAAAQARVAAAAGGAS